VDGQTRQKVTRKFRRNREAVGAWKADDEDGFGTDRADRKYVLQAV